MIKPAEQARSLGDVVRFHAGHQPEAIAQIFAGRRSSYRALDEYASRVANGLRAQGRTPQQRIAYLGLNSDYFFELLFGCAKAGTVLIGLNWRLAAAELAFILNDGEVKTLFIESAFLPLLTQLRAACPGIEAVIVCDGEGAEYPAWRDAQDSRDSQLERGGDEVVMQMYTSGTTGQPKGVLISHRAFFAQMAGAAAADWGEWRDDDLSLVAMPSFHIGGTMWGFTAFYQGSTNLILPAPDVAAVVQAVESGASKMFIVPALLQALVNDEAAQRAELGAMRLIVYGASPISGDVLRRSLQLFGNARFSQHYGMTETAGTICALPPADHDVRGNARMNSCGRALVGSEIRIADADGEPLPAGEVGEILIRSDAVMNGYWKRGEATAAALSGGWYHSGDAGYLDADGYLYICDRIKDLIVSGAENIYPAEVENVLHSHEAVQDVAVIGVPDDRWGEAVKAVVVRRSGAELSEAALIEFARSRIAGYKLPKSVDFVDELPRNASGKLLKHVLRAPYWEGRKRAVN